MEKYIHLFDMMRKSIEINKVKYDHINYEENNEGHYIEYKWLLGDGEKCNWRKR